MKTLLLKVLALFGLQLVEPMTSSRALDSIIDDLNKAAEEFQESIEAFSFSEEEQVRLLGLKNSWDSEDKDLRIKIAKSMGFTVESYHEYLSALLAEHRKTFVPYLNEPDYVNYLILTGRFSTDYIRRLGQTLFGAVQAFYDEEERDEEDPFEDESTENPMFYGTVGEA